MKRFIPAFLLFICSTNLSAQTPFVESEYCTEGAVTVFTADSFPENHAVLAYGTYLRESGVLTLDMITPKLLKYMQKLAIANHCCKVFVDFKNVVLDHLDANGNNLNATYIYYYAIRPVVYWHKQL